MQTIAFDLSQFKQHDRRWKRPYLCIFVGIITAFSLELAYFLATDVGPLIHGELTSVDAVVHVCVDLTLAGFIAIAALSLTRFLPGAESVLLDESTLTIVYGPTKTDQLRWANPRDRLYIQDFRAYPKWPGRGAVCYLYLPFWGRVGRDRRFIITPDLLDALLQLARDNRVTYRTWKGTKLWNGYSPQIHWFQGRGGRS